MTQPVSILLCALGGEGGGVLANWLIDVARLADYPAQATSIPGVAQRTGATTYYLEIYPIPRSQLDGQLPVLGLNPLPGRLHVQRNDLVGQQPVARIRTKGLHGKRWAVRKRLLLAHAMYSS
jgi:hypothetical protein